VHERARTEVVPRSPKYGNDVIMNDVLKFVDEVGREEALLAEAA
jgi:hypothetical protein